MKRVFIINENVYDVNKISAVYMGYSGRTVDGYSIHAVHIVIDGVDVTVYEGVGDVSEIRDKIANVIAENSEIIEI